MLVAVIRSPLIGSRHSTELMRTAVRKVIFLLVRHPLKVVWACVALGLAAYISYLQNEMGGTMVRRPKLLQDGSGPTVYIYPLALRTEAMQDEYTRLTSYLRGIGDDDIVLGKNGVISADGRNGMILADGKNDIISADGRKNLRNIPELCRHLILLSKSSKVDLRHALPQNYTVTAPQSSDAFMQVFDLLGGGKWAEMMLLIIGVIGACSTIHMLFRNFRRIGSRFSLACCSLLMASMDLLFGLAMLRKLGHRLDPLHLMEFGPFFIMSVGFRKSFVLARNIYNHRHKKGDTVGMLCGVEESFGPLLLEYAKEIAIFALFSLSDVSGLREFSLLCVFMLIADAVLLFTFFFGMIAFRMRLHASRNEMAMTSDVENPWRSRAKLVATAVFLALYAFNIITSLSSRFSLELDVKSLLPIIKETVGETCRIITQSTMVVDNLEGITASHVKGAVDIFYEMMTKIFPSYESTNLRTVIQVSISLALPISLVANYYLYRLLKSYRAVKQSNLVPTENAKSRRLIDVSTIDTATDEQIIELIESGKVAMYSLERVLGGDFDRAVRVRRSFIERQLVQIAHPGNISGDSPVSRALPSLLNLPFQGYNYAEIFGTNCENVVGFVTLPVGVAGPIRVDNREYFIPLSTTEGALVASTSRGCKAVSYSGGIKTALLNDGMTRGPVVAFERLEEALRLIQWVDSNFDMIAQVFNGSSRFLRLKKIDCRTVGRLVYLRFKATTGDAMGMNMVSKSTENVLSFVSLEFPSMRIIALSGNACSDKKSAAINWIDGRGKSVVAEAIIPGNIISSILKTTINNLVEVNTAKNLVGSMLAGSNGSGGNAHAANIIAAMFIALGQDPAQVVSSSSCLTFMEPSNNGQDLYISCTMPCLEVGVVGGGTMLSAQRSCIDMLGLDSEEPIGQQAGRLARIIAATVLAGELSLLASLSEGSLVKAHQNHNRIKIERPSSI